MPKVKRGAPRTAHARCNSRMAAEGRWEEYCRRRVQMTHDNVDKDIIWRVCCNLMPPLDGSPPEARVTADLEPLITKYMGDLPELPQEKNPPRGKGWIQVEAGKANRHTTEAHAAFAKEIGEARRTWRNEWDLLLSMVPAGRVASELDVVRWVFENAGTPPDQIRQDDVPSRGALKYLEHVQSSPINYNEFVKTNWSKMLPDKKTLEYEARFSDDGRRVTGLLDQFLETITTEESTDGQRDAGAS